MDSTTSIIKTIIENKINFICSDIERYDKTRLQKKKENEDKNISVYKYEQNNQVITQHTKWIEEISQELRVYRDVLEIINRVIEASSDFDKK